MSTKSSICASAIALMTAAAIVIASPASAALTSSDQARASSLAASIEATVKSTVASDAGKSAADIRRDVEAAIEAAILSSGDSLDVASAALADAQSALAGTTAGQTDGVSQAFARVERSITSGTLPGAGNGNGGNRSNGAGNSAFGTAGGAGGGGGGSGYRGSWSIFLGGGPAAVYKFRAIGGVSGCLSRAALGRARTDRGIARGWTMQGFMRFFAFVAAAVVAPAIAHAQFVTGGVNITPVDQTSMFARDRDVSVRERPRPDYQAGGYQIGSLWLYPKIEDDVEYNDNIYATANNTVSDEIFRIQPEIVLQSNWSVHYFDLYAKANANEYVSHSTENTTDYDFGTDGRIDVVRGTDIKVGAESARLTVPRTSAASPFDALMPVQYYYDTAYLSAEREVNRIRVSLKGDWDRYDYFNVPAIGGGTIIETDQNHDQFDLNGRVDYAFTPGTAWFVEMDGNWRPYHLQGILTPARTSSGYTVLTGANFEVTHLIRGDIGVGYMQQDYRSAAYNNVGGLALRGKLEWFPTELTTVTVTGDREVQDAAIIGSGGYLTTNFGAQIDHELLRNVILTANGTYGHDTYNGVDRRDTRYVAGLSMTYLLNRRMGLNVGYQYFRQDSVGLARGFNFAVNRLMGGLVLQY